MCAINSNYWIDYTLYNQLPDVEQARNLVGEEEQKIKAKELTELIKEVAKEVGIGIPHKHWLLEKDQNIIGYVEEETLYSKPQYNSLIVCPTTWVCTKEGLCAVEGIINPSIEVSQISKKVHEFREKISTLFPLSEEEKFSKFSVAISPGAITHFKDSYFLETNNNGISVLKPMSKEEMQISDTDTILTYIAVEPDEKGITKVACQSLCLELGGGHGRVHAYSDSSSKRDPIEGN